MEISNEAKLNHFPIGPSSLLGRTVAFRVLFCGSVAHLRRRLLVAIAASMHKIKKTVGPLLLCLHPKNTREVLVSMTLLFFLLRRHTNVHSWAVAAYRRRFWRSNMRKAMTFEEWSNAAKMLEKETPRTGDARLYDEELVREKLVELRHRRQKGSPRDIVFYMRADLLRNLGDMCNPQLHKGRLQVPKLISEYIDEVSTQLRMVCNTDSDDLPIDERLSFMHETRHAFGRTALLLSGGATLGAFHIGVVRTLVEHKLLPRIIAGSSVGSIICAIASTRTDPELKHFFDHSLQSLRFFDPLGGVFAVVRRVATHGAVHEIRQLQSLLREITSNMTFQEAYDLTGRILGVTVCSPRKHEKPRCLNYLTSPHVLIWSAVTASCAFPGLFEAQELMAKNRFGELVPYHASFQPGGDEATAVATAKARKWRDGSLESDLPIGQLKELFNVNHFIVSQANPHIAPILRAKELIRSYLGDFAAKIAQLLELEVKNRCSQILELGIPIGADIAKLFAQDWEGDITIVMPATLSQYLKIIQNPKYTDLKMAADQGRQCTWEKLSAIRANCAIELVLDECVALLNHARRLKRREERFASFRGTLRTPTFSAHRRIPSWNCIARDTGTFSDDDTSRTPTPHPVGAGRRNGRGHRYVQDGSDSEAESPSFHSWARVSSPAVRTPDAGKPPRTPRSPDRRPLPPPSPNSIVVGHGDFLQTERTDNGFVFNVVRKEDLTPRTCGEQRLQSKGGGEDAEELLDSMHGNASDSGEEDSSSS